MQAVLLAVALTGITPLHGAGRPAVSMPRMSLAVEVMPISTVQPASEPAPFCLREAALGRKALFASGLAFLSGVADVATYTSAGCYASMMTGNTISLVSALASLRVGDSLFFFSMVANYVLGVAAFRLLGARKGPVADGAIVPVILVLFAVVDWVCKYVQIDRPQDRWIEMYTYMDR